MDLLTKISDRLDTVNFWVGRTAAWLSVPIIAITIFDVVSRRFFTVGSVTLQELEWHLYAILFLLCLGFAYQNDGHVRVDILRARLSPYVKAWIEFIGCVVFMVPYCIVIIYLGFLFVADSFLLSEISDAPGGLPYRFLIKSALPIGFFFLLVQATSTAIKQFVIISDHLKKGV